MANRKLPYNWEMVSAGDIISFKYKSKSTGKSKVHTIMVLNPSLLRRGQKKTSTQLIGIKLEESNKNQLEITKKQIQIFEQIGKFITIDKEMKWSFAPMIKIPEEERENFPNEQGGFYERKIDTENSTLYDLFIEGMTKINELLKKSK